MAPPSSTPSYRLRVLTLALLAGCVPPGAQPAEPRTHAAPGFLYVWTTALDTFMRPPVPPDTIASRRVRGVVLVAVDIREGSPTSGRVVSVVFADSSECCAHHTEHALEPDGVLFANNFWVGRTHRFDLRAPGEPRLLGAFTTAGPFGYPHSFARLPSGNVLATFQGRASAEAPGTPPGALVELRRDGTPVRWTSAAMPEADSAALRPYSLEVLPGLDRVVTTSFGMGTSEGVHVQVWRLSDLSLLHTLRIPEAPAHAGHDAHAAGEGSHGEVHHRLPGEPRALADGRTVMIGTFTCGLYRLTGIDTPAPRLEFVHAFPGQNCAVPARVGRWWVQTVPALRALVTLDLADPARPREVSRLVFAAPAAPHWLAADPSGRRLVMSSARGVRVHLVRLDAATGALAHDASLPTIDLSRVEVPGRGTLRLMPHGVVFNRP
ncbi:MAG: dTDP-4-dehydrorhamnose 3,5-epimerase [Gemmatimonadetes bacterium]|nr:dTDP-4-dehydrorhamnose 3,5-epimerase [Gemmatimonadota bacterium]